MKNNNFDNNEINKLILKIKFKYFKIIIDL